MCMSVRACLCWGCGDMQREVFSVTASRVKFCGINTGISIIKIEDH